MNKLTNETLMLTFNEDDCIRMVHKQLEDIKQNISTNSKCLLYNKDNISPNNIDITIDEAINNFKRTIQLIYALSHGDSSSINYEPTPCNCHFTNFIFKNTPSLPYEDFVNRIENKCMFDPVVYQAATYLLQILFLKRNHLYEKMILKHRLQENEIHKIIIATIRIAARLVEDHIHSHEYFSKVVGVSKKLLMKLEVKLLLCLKCDGLMILSEKLAASASILQELETYIN